FIDMEHTPKNILIRAVKDSTHKKNDKREDRRLREADALAAALGLEPTMRKLVIGSEECVSPN
ncbi:MAG: class I SAM-dependent methyltransferase, partial [Treponema sp.]